MNKHDDNPNRPRLCRESVARNHKRRGESTSHISSHPDVEEEIVRSDHPIDAVLPALDKVAPTKKPIVSVDGRDVTAEHDKAA